MAKGSGVGACPRAWVRWALLSVLAAMGGVGGCGKDVAEQDAGTLRTSVNVSALQQVVTRVHIDVRPATAASDLTYNAQTGNYEGSLDVRTGSQTITATAFNGDMIVGEGDAVAAVTKHGTATIIIKILDETPSPADQDHGPIITSITASTVSPMVGDVINLQIKAVDPDGDSPTYQWSQDCAGVFGAPTSASTTWYNNQVQMCSLTATVRSRALTDTARLTITVQPATGTLQFAVEFVPLPYVSHIKVVGGALNCDVARDAPDASCRPAIDEQASATVTVTFDPMPAGSATVALTDGCGGVVTPSDVALESGTASFTWTAPASTATCMLTAAITRETLYDAQRIAVAVK